MQQKAICFYFPLGVERTKNIYKWTGVIITIAPLSPTKDISFSSNCHQIDAPSQRSKDQRFFSRITVCRWWWQVEHICRHSSLPFDVLLFYFFELHPLAQTLVFDCLSSFISFSSSLITLYRLSLSSFFDSISLLSCNALVVARVGVQCSPSVSSIAHPDPKAVRGWHAPYGCTRQVSECLRMVAVALHLQQQQQHCLSLVCQVFSISLASL